MDPPFLQNIEQLSDAKYSQKNQDRHMIYTSSTKQIWTPTRNIDGPWQWSNPSKRSSLTQTGKDNDDKDLNTFLITWTWKAWEFKGQLQK